MMDLEFTFEENALQAFLHSLKPGATVQAETILSLADQTGREDLEETLSALTEKRISLDVGNLTVEAGAGTNRLKMEENLAKQQDMTCGLEENDPLRLYLEEIAATPVAGDVNILAAEYLAGKQEAASMLTNLCLSRVIAISREMTGKGVLLLDLIQEGSLGLWQSIGAYSGGDFESHCDWYIRQYMAGAVVLQAADSGLGAKLRQGMEDYRDVDQKLLAELGRNPTLEEIAESLHMTLSQAQMVESMVMSARLVASAHQEPEEKEEDPEDTQAVEDTAYFQSRQRIFEMLSGLTEQEKKLITLRYGLESGKPLSTQQVAEVINISPEEALSLEAGALAKMRKEG